MVHQESIPLQADTYKLNTVSAAQTELAYVFVKSVDAERCTIPSWTGFHTLLQGDGTLQKSALYYLGVIEASPTEMSTVNTILKRSVRIADQLELTTGGGTQLVKIYGQDQKTPTQWKKFISDGTNKEALAEFLYVVW